MNAIYALAYVWRSMDEFIKINRWMVLACLYIQETRLLYIKREGVGEERERRMCLWGRKHMWNDSGPSECWHWSSSQPISTLLTYWYVVHKRLRERAYFGRTSFWPLWTKDKTLNGLGTDWMGWSYANQRRS